MLTVSFKNASFGPSPNLRKRISLVLNFSKMLLLAPLQIFTRVFHLWKSIVPEILRSSSN